MPNVLLEHHCRLVENLKQVQACVQTLSWRDCGGASPAGAPRERPCTQAKQVHVSRKKAHKSTHCGPIFLWNSANLCRRPDSQSSKHGKPGKKINE